MEQRPNLSVPYKSRETAVMSSFVKLCSDIDLSTLLGSFQNRQGVHKFKNISVQKPSAVVPDPAQLGFYNQNSNWTMNSVIDQDVIYLFS